MPEKNGLTREVTCQKRSLYKSNGQQVPNLLACHERVAAHERDLSKKIILYMYILITFLPKR